MSVSVDIKNTVKMYGDFKAIDDVSIEIKEGEFFTLLGPSGCGKTTLLRMIAGFNSIEAGEILFDGEVINNKPAHKRDIGMVFQNYAVFPHLSIYDNVGYGLKARKVNKEEANRRIMAALKTVQIDDLKDRMPSELSGGQQQRVALARCLAQDPKIILADEPVASLDPVTAVAVMDDFVRINEATNITVIINIHHVDLALKYAKRVIGIRAEEVVYDGPSSEVSDNVLGSVYGRELAEDEIMVNK